MFTENYILNVGGGPEWAKDKNLFESQLKPYLNDDWYDTFKFDNGVYVQGRSPSELKLHALSLPLKLNGYTILDVGAYEGFYSFHMEQRGANVTSQDNFIWNAPLSPSRNHFDFMRQALGSKISIVESDIREMALDKRFDITLFLGVLYHLEDPIGVLRHLRKITSRLVILEILVDSLDKEGNILSFYPGSSLNNDSTNKFAPNLSSLVGMSQEAGFRSFEFKNIWEINTVQAHTSSNMHYGPLRSGRAVFYLYP